ncbi:MAG: nuclear transport factor 2 family protein [Gemmatimonadaceae bacterium]
MSTRAKIEETTSTLYRKVFNEGKADLLPGLIAGPYIQHNPLFPNGPEPLMGYLKQAGNIPCEIKRMAIDGNLAFIHVRYLNWAGKEHAAVDIFRFNEDGKIVEHWDVLQPVPETASNNNTMF